MNYLIQLNFWIKVKWLEFISSLDWIPTAHWHAHSNTVLFTAFTFWDILQQIYSVKNVYMTKYSIAGKSQAKRCFYFKEYYLVKQLLMSLMFKQKKLMYAISYNQIVENSLTLGVFHSIPFQWESIENEKWT